MANGLAFESIKHMQEFIELGAQSLGAHRAVCLGVRLLSQHFRFFHFPWFPTVNHST